MMFYLQKSYQMSRTFGDGPARPITESSYVVVTGRDVTEGCLKTQERPF
jgi:hypothetical protein